MTDSLDGRRSVRGIRDYRRWIGSTIVVVSAILFSLGAWAAAVGALLGLMFFLSLSRRIRSTFHRPEGDATRPSGVWTIVGIQSTTVAVFLFITLLIGGTVVDVCFTALCTETLAFLALIVLMTSPNRRRSQT
jgi:multisubunit Na+/H+ antiporter MnhB subunit